MSGGVEVLAHPLYTEVGTLDAAGLGTSSILLPPGNATYWVQFQTRTTGGALFATTPVSLQTGF